MNIKLLGMTAAVIGSLAVAGIARAQPHHFGPGPGLEFIHGLNLTEDQQTQIKEIGKANWKSMKALMKQEHALHEQETNQLLASGSVTVEQLQPIVAQEEALRTQIDNARLATMVQIRGVLTAEQVSAAATKHAQMEQLHEQEHALMGHGPEEEGPEGP